VERGKLRWLRTNGSAGDGSIAERVDAARAACGWDLAVADDVRELPPPTGDEIAALRRWDPRGWFLRDR